MANRNSVYVNVTNGIFFFKDSPHYLYGIKKTTLLEEIKQYNIEYPEAIKTIYDSYLKDTPGANIEIGYGNKYGKEYGGPTLEGSNKLSINISEEDSSTSLVIDAFSRVSLNADVKVLNPSALVTSVNIGLNEITIPYTDRDNVPNVFGLNKGSSILLKLVSQGEGISVTKDPDVGTTVDGSYTEAFQGILLTVIKLSTQTVAFSQMYNTFASTVAADNLAAKLLEYDSDHILLLTTWDDAMGSSTTLLKNTIYTLGGTYTKFGQLAFKAPYILAAIPGKPNESIELSAPGNNGERIETSFYIDLAGILKPKEYPMKLSLQGIYDVDNNLVANNPAQFYSVYTERNNLKLDYAEFVQQHTSQNVVGIPIRDINIGPYLRQDDEILITYPNTVYRVATAANLPPSNEAIRTAAYYVIDENKYYIIDSNGLYVIRNTFLTQQPRTVKMRVKPNVNSDLYQGDYIFAEPENFADLDFFDVVNDGQLFQYLLKFWDGIPPGCKVETNTQEVIANKIDANVATLQFYHLEKTITVDFYEIVGGQVITMNAHIPSGLKLTYTGYGVEYKVGLDVFLDDADISYPIIDRSDESSPVVITDLLASDLDSVDFTNSEFMVDNGHILFNRVKNKIANPSFFKQGSPIAGWDVSAGVELNKDYEKLTAIVHDRCAKIINTGNYIQQFISKIDPNTRYCLSFYATSPSATVQVEIYEFNNEGTRFIDFPDLNDATNVMTFVPHTVTSVFDRYVARLYNDNKFNKDLTTEILYVNDPLPALQSTTTDIVIVISKAGGASPLYISAVQLEEGKNPSFFSHDYDYALVEYETGPKSYMPRFNVSSVENALNNGFLVLDFTEVRVNDAGMPSDNLSYAFRKNVSDYFARRPWAKINGVTKYRQTGIFSNERIPHKGEYFLSPIPTKASRISFQSDVLLNTQSLINLEAEDERHLVVLENTRREVLEGESINVTYGVSKTRLVNNEKLTTDGTGSAKFKGPVVYNEDVSLYYSYGTDAFNSDYRIYRQADVDLIFDIGEYGFPFNKDGSYGRVHKSAAGGNVNTLTLDNDTNDWGYDVAITHLNCDYIIKSKTASYLKILSSLPYDPDFENSGNSVFTYFSGVDNLEKQPSLYNNLLVTKTHTATTNRNRGDDYFNLSANPSFRPLRNSLKISVPGRPILDLLEANQNDGIISRFFVDYENKRVYVPDQSILTIDLSWKIHPIFFDVRSVYFHRSILFNIVNSVYNTIASTSVSNQHTFLYNTDITNIIGALDPLSFELYLKVHTNVNIYVKARHKGLIDEAVMLYQHRKPLI